MHCICASNRTKHVEKANRLSVVTCDQQFDITSGVFRSFISRGDCTVVGLLIGGSGTNANTHTRTYTHSHVLDCIGAIYVME